MKFNPRSYQQLGIEHLMRNPRAGLFAQPGLGKTVMSLTTIDMQRLFNLIDKTLVVMPKRVLDTEGWQRELAKWDHLQDLAIETITGNAAQRREKLRSPAPIHLINYELLPWLLDELVRCWPYDRVDLDESTKVKGHDSTWFKGNSSTKDRIALGSTLDLPDGRRLILDAETRAKLPGNTRVRQPKDATETRLITFAPTPGLKHVSTQTKRWTNLTGTPMPNGVQDVWSPTFLLDQGQRLGENISRFREQYMVANPYIRGKYNPRPDALPRVISQIDDICLSIKAADYLDLPELISNTIEIKLDDAMMREYKKLEDTFFLQLEGKVIEAANSAVLSNKLLQFTQGVLYTDKTGAWQEIHKAKVDAIKELSDEVNAPMLLAYHFDFDRDRLLKIFKGAVEFNGTLKQIEAFGRGHIQHLVLHPGNAGHGIEGLQDGSDTIAFFGSHWSLEEHDQVIERIGPTRQLQSGHPRPVFAHYLVAQNTVDEMLIERLVHKKTEQEIFMNALKRRKEA